MAASGPEAALTAYELTAPELPVQPPLQGRARADVCILGAGFTGLSAAIELAQAGLSVIVLEANVVGSGASGRNGGQVIFGYSKEQAQIAALVGLQASQQLFDWTLEGMQLLHERCARFGIDAQWRPGHAHLPIKPRHVAELHEFREDLAENYGYELEWWPREQLRGQLASDRYLGALYDPRSGHVQPLSYVRGLARAALSLGVRIHEASPVISLQRDGKPVLRTAAGEVGCDFAVLGGNALMRGIAPELESRIMPVGTYIGATPPLGEDAARALIANGMAAADTNWALDYFRIGADTRLLFGGRASYSTLPPPNLRGTMEKRMRRVFPQLAGTPIERVWGGWIDISRNRAPHWGRLGTNIYFAQGFSGHGVVISGLAGRVIAEAIRGQSERLDVYARIPHRKFPGGRMLRTPLLVAAMAWFKLRDALW
jgi:gamma-glutamylputrescine oxidase